MKFAMLLAGGNVHARILLTAIVNAGLTLDTVVNETGTPLAKKLTDWLVADASSPTPFESLVQKTKAKLYAVSSFHGDHAKELLAGSDYVINGGCGILRQSFLDLPRLGFLNVHPGLLPEFRGLDPVLWSLAEDGPLGATLHLMSQGIDEGAILIRESAALRRSSLVETRLACMELGADLLVRFMRNPSAYLPQSQDSSRARYFGAFPDDRRAEAEAHLR